VLVTVRLFARLREIAGSSELSLELPAGATVQAAWNELTRQQPGLAPYAPTVSCAVNADYARMATVLQEEDDVAFLPPVSGG
jgi:molybdopterin converting factor subunit 1